MKRLARPSKSPFVGYSVEEIFESEAISWVLQIGDDVYSHKGMIVFDKGMAAKLEKKFIASFQYLIENGTKQEKLEALKIIGTVKMMPLRVQ